MGLSTNSALKLRGLANMGKYNEQGKKLSYLDAVWYNGKVFKSAAEAGNYSNTQQAAADAQVNRHYSYSSDEKANVGGDDDSSVLFTQKKRQNLFGN